MRKRWLIYCKYLVEENDVVSGGCKRDTLYWTNEPGLMSYDREILSKRNFSISSPDPQHIGGMVWSVVCLADERGDIGIPIFGIKEFSLAWKGIQKVGTWKKNVYQLHLDLTRVFSATSSFKRSHPIMHGRRFWTTLRTICLWPPHHPNSLLGLKVL